MSPKSKKPSEVIEWLKALWAPVASFFVTVAGVVEFIKLWRNESVTTTIVVTALISAAIIASLWFFSFSTKRKWSKADQKYHKVPRYTKYYQIARIALGSVTLLALVSAGIVYWQVKSLDGKIVVLVTNFKGTSPENYLVNEKLYRQLHESLNGYADVVVKSSNVFVTEYEGSDRATALGKRYRADIVLWGYYAVTASDVLITVHVENLKDEEIVPIRSSSTAELQDSVTQLNSFAIQQQLADQMTALMYFVASLTRLRNNDFSQGAKLLTLSLESADWAEEIISRSYVLDYRARAYYLLGKTQDAFVDIDEAIKLQPDNPNFFLTRGALYFDQGDIDQGLVNTNQAIKLNPKLAKAYFLRSAIYEKLGEYDRALADLSYIIELEPNDISSYHNRSYFYLVHKNDYQRALEDLNRAIEINPTDYEVYHERGRYYINIGKYEAAIIDLTEAIKISPKLSILYNDRAVAYDGVSNHKRACQDLRQALKVLPDNDLHASEAYRAVGDCFLYEGDLQQALSEANRAIDMIEAPERSILFRDDDFRAYELRATIYSKMGRYGEAVDDISLSIQIYPVEPHSTVEKAYLYYERAGYYLSLNEKENAIQDFQTVLLQSNDETLKSSSAAALKNLGVNP